MFNNICGLAFIGLGILDAYFSKCNLAQGGSELNPLMVNLGDNMIAKGLISLAVIILFYTLNWGRWLLPMCLVMLGIVTWNLFILWL